MKYEGDECRAFVKLLHAEYIKSNLGLGEFAEKLNTNATRLALLFSGKRHDFSFSWGVMVANHFGIDLGEFQKRFKYKPIETRKRNKYFMRRKAKSKFVWSAI